MGLQLAMSVLNARRRGRLRLLGVGLRVSSCNGREPLELRPPTTCRTPELIACLPPYAFRKLEPDQLRRLVEEVPRCLATNDRALLEQQTSLHAAAARERSERLAGRAGVRLPLGLLRIGPLPTRQGKVDEPCPAPTLG